LADRYADHLVNLHQPLRLSRAVSRFALTEQLTDPHLAMFQARE
jgi:hypothetical protein